MVAHHEDSVPCFYGRVVSLVHDADDELCLAEGHGRVEAAGVHSLRIEVAATADVSIKSKASFDACMVVFLLSPRAMSPAPKAVLIINI
jgi:hypothetical protein